MAIAFEIGGARTVIPGVYDSFRVANSLPAPAPAGRSVYIIGEAEEGVPGEQLDVRLNFYTDFQAVRDFYKTGAIVDAARMLFSSQPSPVFSGAIQRLYVYKTNDSTRAERDLNGPSGYGSLLAARFGEEGNLIKTQVVDAQTETLPTKTFAYLPSSAAQNLSVVVSGVVTTPVALAANELASDLQPLLNAVTDLTATGGDARTDTITGDITITALDDTLTLTTTTTFGADIAVGDICYISAASGFAGGVSENTGSYMITAATTTAITMKQLNHDGVNAEAFDLTISPVLAATLDLLINAPITITHTGTTAVGGSASLEILEDGAAKQGAASMFRYSDFNDLLASSTSTIANITTSVPSAGSLRLDLDTGAWISTPKVGDLIFIGRDSLVAGATALNVGAMIVTAAGAQTLTAAHLSAGMTTEAVASQSLAGVNGTVEWAAGFVSTEIAAKRIDGAAERKVRMEASRESDGISLADNSIGGNVALEIGYFDVTATACKLTIDNKRILTITPTGGSLTPIVVNTRKYSSLQELVTFLNTRTGVSAKVSQPAYNSLSTAVLDMVTDVGCLDGQTEAAYSGKIKKDYTDWVRYFTDNFGLIAFKAGGLATLAGLPDAEAIAQFLDGADIGSTNSASIQAALDAGLKLEVRQVIPLFSRDANKDVLDGLTDAASTYSIDSIHAASKSHVSTASSKIFKKERFAMLSHYGSFADSQLKAQGLAFERCQMTFQLHNATDGEGVLRRFLPWIASCAIAAGRSQAILGTSMLRKPFLLSSAVHLGDVSLFSDSLIPDFDPEDRGQLTDAITAGLLVLNAVTGFGVRMESPDLTTRSRDNDPQAWVWERAAVLFTTDEVRQTVRTVLENFIGNRQSDTPTAVVRQAADDALGVFRTGTGNGSLIAGQITSFTRTGTQYNAEMQIRPVEAIEAVTVDVLATREIG